MPETFRWAILYNGHHLTTTGQPGTRRVRENLWCQIYWPTGPQMSTTTLKNTNSGERIVLTKTPALDSVIPTQCAFRILTIDILGLMTKTKQRNCFVAVRAVQYSRLIRDISTVKNTAPVFAACFFNHWTVSCKILHTAWYNGQQFVPKFLTALCASLRSWLVTITEYHPHPNG